MTAVIIKDIFRLDCSLELEITFRMGEMKKAKVIVFGLDGATWNVLKPMMDAGELPYFSRVAKEGVWGTLKSTIPPVTPPAWATFVTGKNPGKHGLFGFVVNKHNASIETSWANENAIKTPKIWDLLDHLDRTSALINIPITYPAKKINGWYVSGFLTPQGAKDVTYPPELLEELDSVVGGYIINVPSGEKSTFADANKFTEANLECTRKRADAMFYLKEKYDPDLLFTVFVGPDRIQHRFYGYLDPNLEGYNAPKSISFRDVISQNFVQLDEILGEILENINDDTTLLVASDHGFGPLKSFISINRWLANNSYLKYNKFGAMLREIDRKFGISNRFGNMKRIQKSLTFDAKLEEIIDMAQTRVFAGDIYEEGLYINLKGRQENGIVEQGEEYENLRDEVIDGLRSLTFPETGEPVFTKLLKKEEVYQGAYLDDAPDILVVSNDNKSLITNNLPTLKSHFIKSPRNKFEGTHEPEGIFMAWGSKIRKSEEFGTFDIHDIAPTILFAMGEPTFSDMDGSTIVSIFKDKKDQEVVDPPHYNMQSDTGYTDKESRDIEERLRKLGYLE